MKDRTKVVLSGAALALAVFCGVQAHAGNAVVAGAQYFSLTMNSGSYFTYTGSDSDAVLLVDDVTYSTDINPADAMTRYAYWSPNLVGPPPITNGNPVAGLAALGLVYTVARGTSYHAEMWESTATGTGVQFFDAIAHATHSELFVMHDDYEAPRFDLPPPGFFVGPIGAVPPGLRSTNRYRTAVNESAAPELVTVKGVTGVGLSSWAVQTSESRHYQSPQVVQYGRRVYFGEPASTRKYASAKVYVKGRVILDINAAPVESVDVTVTAP